MSKMDEPDLSAPWRPAKNDAHAYNEGVREGCRLSAARIAQLEAAITPFADNGKHDAWIDYCVDEHIAGRIDIDHLRWALKLHPVPVTDADIAEAVAEARRIRPMIEAETGSSCGHGMHDTRP